MYRQIDANKRKTWLLMLSFLAFLGLVGFALDRLVGMGHIFLWAVLAVAVLMNLVGYYYGDKVALVTSRAREITRAENPDLYRLVDNLTIAAGLPIPRLYLIDSSAPNAFSTGREPRHAALVATRGLLNKLDKAELEGVLSHELSHINNYDTRLMATVTVLLGWVALLGALLARWMLGSDPFLAPTLRDQAGAGESRRTTPPPHPIIFVALLLAMVGGQTAKLMALVVSRSREFLADAEGAMITRYPEGLASALQKISADPEPLEVANKATAHFFIVDPFRWRWEQGFWTRLLGTHPPIEERIAALRTML